MKRRHQGFDIEHLQIVDKVSEIKKSDNPTIRQIFSEMTVKQRDLAIRMLTRTGDQDKIAMVRAAGYQVNEKSRAAGIIKQVSGKLGPLLLSIGITEADLVEKCQELLWATKVQFVKINEYKDGKVVGQTLQAVEVPDNTVRQKQLDMIMKLGDYFPAQKFEKKTKLDARVTSDIPISQQDILRQNIEIKNAIDTEFTVETVDEDKSNAPIN